MEIIQASIEALHLSLHQSSLVFMTIPYHGVEKVLKELGQPRE